MKSITLEEIIRQYVHLPHINAKGWNPCVHKICDHGRKGERAAFLFDGDIAVFHCYNCGVKTKYDPSSHKTLSRKMQTILSDFDIPESEWQQVVFSNFGNQTTSAKQTNQPTINIEPTVLPLPKEFYFLKDALPEDKTAIIAKTYLNTKRGIDWTTYPFMLAMKSDNMFMRKWLNRIIIPIYNKKGELIFYQGRDISETAQKKYQNPKVDANKIIHGFDLLFKYNDTSPLYIMEGWFDAHLMNGIALLGNSISEEQAIWINKSSRPKVFIPDRFGNGKEVALHALTLGWSIATPDIGSDPTCKDMTDVINKYGKFYTMKTLADRTASGFAAKTQLELYCKT